MSVELESVKRIQSLKNGIESVTGETYNDLTEGIQALKDGYGQGGGKEEQEKTVDITENGTTEVLPDYGKVLSKVTVNVDVPNEGEEIINGLETLVDDGCTFEGGEQTLEEKVAELIQRSEILVASTAINLQYNTKIESIDVYLSANYSGLNYAFNGTSNLKRMVGINTSKAAAVNRMFYQSGIEVIEQPLDFSSTINSTNTNGLYGARKLREVRFVPNTIKFSNDISSGVLSDESIQSIVDGLADLTGGTQQTLTLHATVTAKLTEAQIATITRKNWVVA